MKHKIVTHSFSTFEYLWAGLIEKLKQSGEKIVRTKLSFVQSAHFSDKFAAIIWTKEHEKEACVK